MDYNDVALFTRVVETGSFTAAAQAAGIPKSSVTRSVARLERELGVRLIQRTTRQRGVTDAGQALFSRVRGAVAALDSAAAEVRELGGEPRGIVRVTAPADCSEMGVPEAIARFVQLHPKIQIELMLTARVVDLVREGFDLAIRAGRLADSTLVARRIGQVTTGLFAAPSYLRRRGCPKKPADLANHDCVLFRGRLNVATWELLGPDGTVSVDVSGPVNADDFSFVLRQLIAGSGIGPAPQVVARQAVRDGKLKRVLPDYDLSIGGGALHIVLPSSEFVPARVALLRDFLYEELTRLFTEAG